RRDRRVVEPRRRLRLAQHAFGPRPLDLLDRDLALEALVEGAVDDAHAARADSLEQAEALHHQLSRHTGFPLRRLQPPSCPRRAPCADLPPSRRSYCFARSSASLTSGRAIAFPIRRAVDFFEADEPEPSTRR